MLHSRAHNALPTHWRICLAVLISFLIVSPATIILRRLQASLLVTAHPTLQAAQAAARLDPSNELYPIQIAQVLQDQGRDPLPAWRRAIAINPRNDLALTQAAIASEMAGDLPGAERLLLQAARTNQLWLPRWSLANFYFRRGQPGRTLHWAALALQRAYGDRTALFRLCREAGASPERILQMIEPADAENLASYIHFLAADAQPAPLTLEAAAAGYLQAARASSLPPERILTPVVHAVNALIASGQPSPAIRLWDRLSAAGLLPYPARTPARPLVNPDFARPLPGGGFDWRIRQIPGIESYPGVPARGIKFIFSGSQPESATLLQQVLYLQGGRSWQLSHDCQTLHLTSANAGLAWTLTPAAGGPPLKPASAMPLAADDWSRISASWALPPGDALYRLSLEIRRPAGQTRAEGEARLRAFSLREARP